MISTTQIYRFSIFTFLLFVSSIAYADRITEDFKKDWFFSKGEQAQDVSQLKYDDSHWEQVQIPHDWAISGPFNPEENGYAAKLPWYGVGWYRKKFHLDDEYQGKQIYLDFNGVMAFPKVYINGKLAGEWDYGYSSFRIDVTPFVKIGEENIVAVMADTRNHGTRWYPGAGIYRKVSMTICEPVHIAHWGMYITTPEIQNDSAVVQINTTVTNHNDSNVNAKVVYELFDPQGRLVGHDQVMAPISASDESEVKKSIRILNPQRWDIDDPQLYTAKATVYADVKKSDCEISTFGIRTFQFTANDGFHLNGRRVQLYGVNLHHDHGPLGAAFYPRAMERQLEIMKEMGCNAIRTSHNAPAPELVEICDRMGLVVWDEVFDKWDRTAGRVNGKPPLREFGERQIRNMVMRDRNHPSVVTWSIGNEITNQPWNREGKSSERVTYMSDFRSQIRPNTTRHSWMFYSEHRRRTDS
jgi:beta-galactosidase